MYTFSDKSEAALATMHPDLQRVFRTAIQIKDFAVIEGHREEEAQHAAFLSGASKVDWPLGKHNKIPSDAGDVRPFDPVTHQLVPWSQTGEYILLAGVILACAKLLDIPLRWGHDWNRNMMMTDEGGKLVDMPHYELVHVIPA